MFYTTLILSSAFSFFFYSIRSFVSKDMIEEYSRWGFKKSRKKIAFFQFLSAIMLIIGIYNLPLLALTSCLLGVMMIGAIIVRVKIKDSFIDTLPAIFYSVINFTIFYITCLKLV